MLSSRLSATSVVSISSKNKFWRRVAGVMGADRPLRVVHIEKRIDRNQIEVGFVVGVDRSNISPVRIVLPIFITKGKRMNTMAFNKRGKNIVTKIMMA